MIEKKVFANPKQIKFMASRAKRKTFHAGRGSAKTHTLAYCVYLAYEYMARAKFVLAGLTYVQLDLVVLPVIKEALTYCGVVEYNPKTNPYGHYVVGVKPPENWLKPYKPVGRLGYQYCMSFINGFTLQFVSQDRAETNRGLSFDGILNDESATTSSDFISKVLRKALRGNIFKHFSNHYLFQCHYDFSSAAWTQAGMHIYKTEELWMAEQEQRKNFSQAELLANPPRYLFLEATCLDNPLAGAEYMERERAESDPLEFEVEVMNRRLTRLPNGFYFAFSTSKHCYWEKQRYVHDDKTGLTYHYPNDYREDKPLDVSLDFNADICWQIVGQEVGDELRLINSNYVKPTLAEESNIVRQNATWFCDTYSTHGKKEVFLYGDKGGINRSATTSKENKPFFDTYSDVLKERGWIVYQRIENYAGHKDKYILFNMILEERSERIPKLRINQNNGHNKVVIISLQCTVVKTNDDRFEKDKSSEQKNTRNREYATDSSDALDYWVWAKCKKFSSSKVSQKNQLYIYQK
jgi:hypothetical protein